MSSPLLLSLSLLFSFSYCQVLNINCVSVFGSSSTSGSTASCPTGDTLVGCGIDGSQTIGGVTLDINGDCFAETDNGDTFEVRAVARCCTYPAGSVSAVTTELQLPILGFPSPGTGSTTCDQGTLTSCLLFSNPGPTTPLVQALFAGTNDPPQTAAWIDTADTCTGTASGIGFLEPHCVTFGSDFTVDCETIAISTSGDGFGGCRTEDFHMTSCTGDFRTSHGSQFFVTNNNTCFANRESGGDFLVTAVCCRMIQNITGTLAPSMDPTLDPTADPTADPTDDPTVDPTADPTVDPTNDPTSNPTTGSPTTASPTTASPTTAEPTPPTTAEPTSDMTSTLEMSTSMMSTEEIELGCDCEDGMVTISLTYTGTETADITVTRKKTADSDVYMSFTAVAPGEELIINAQDGGYETFKDTTGVQVLDASGNSLCEGTGKIKGCRTSKIGEEANGCSVITFNYWIDAEGARCDETAVALLSSSDSSDSSDSAASGDNSIPGEDKDEATALQTLSQMDPYLKYSLIGLFAALVLMWFAACYVFVMKFEKQKDELDKLDARNAVEHHIEMQNTAPDSFWLAQDGIETNAQYVD